ncbi:MAG: DUF4279 domain-containing protein [Chloroflexota bacterium]
MRTRKFFDYNDKYPTCKRTYATLCIYLPDTIQPNTLSEKLGVQPSRTQVKGEVRKGKIKQWPTAWFLESQGKVKSKDVRRHIDWLLNQLEGKSEIIKQLQSTDVQMHISCFWASAVGHGGPMLDATLLKQLSEVNLGIAFDIYFEGNEKAVLP